MLRVNPCSCGVHYLVRIDRDWWMRAIPGRRHYYCAHCKTRQLLPRRAFVSTWMPRNSAETKLPPQATSSNAYAPTAPMPLGTR